MRPETNAIPVPARSGRPRRAHRAQRALPAVFRHHPAWAFPGTRRERPLLRSLALLVRLKRTCRLTQFCGCWLHLEDPAEGTWLRTEDPAAARGPPCPPIPSPARGGGRRGAPTTAEPLGRSHHRGDFSYAQGTLSRADEKLGDRSFFPATQSGRYGDVIADV